LGEGIFSAAILPHLLCLNFGMMLYGINLTHIDRKPKKIFTTRCAQGTKNSTRCEFRAFVFKTIDISGRYELLNFSF
jgi:hypothetical protein